MNHVSLDQLTLATFLPLVNSVFRVQTNDSAFAEFQLMSALPARHSRPDATGDHKSFSLFFAGPGERMLEQRIHLFQHEKIGQFELFIVPIGRKGGKFEYQAAFNRLDPET